MHGAVRTLTTLVRLERRDQVLRALAVQLGHRVRGVHVLVVRNRVAAIAGVGQFLALLGVAVEGRCGILGLGLTREGGEQQGGGERNAQ